ncbi:MAG TPA: hypothetical protein VFH40_09245 [Gemmatimonadales bacterium]|jgi:hypothetical protein|nr:hypothetical protein [Gemmatimonadales bacterium]
MHRIRPPIPLLVALLGLSACSDSTSPGDTTRNPSELNVVRFAPATPPLFNPVDSFYAKKGEDREVRIFFQDEVGGSGEEFLRLSVSAPSLLARPDGTPFLPGDSVLIKVSIADPAKIIFDMEPAGLTFDPAQPAELKIEYRHADHDFNEDGATNLVDDQIKHTLAIWRQETPADPFVRLGSVNEESLEEISADILGFTRYAIAY